MTALGWWLVALMAAIMVADWAGVLMQAHQARRIEGARGDLQRLIDGEDVRHRQRLAEIRATAAKCDEARRKCEVAKAAMDAAWVQFGALMSTLDPSRAGRGDEGNVVRLPVLKLADVAAEAAGGE